MILRDNEISLRIKQVVAFEIIKEKRHKHIENRYILNDDEINNEKYGDFKKFLEDNFTAIISLDETDYTDKKRVSRTYLKITPYKISGKSFVFEIEKESKLLKTHDLLKKSLNCNNEDFVWITTELAMNFVYLKNWRHNIFMVFAKIYLESDEIRNNFLAIFLVDLEIGRRLMLSPEKVAELIRKPIFERIVKKGAIFPYIETHDRINLLKIKTYTSGDSSIPTYLFEFLALKKPPTAEDELIEYLNRAGGSESLFISSDNLPIKRGIRITLINEKGTKVEFDVRELTEGGVKILNENNRSGVLVRGNIYNIKIGDKKIKSLRLIDLYKDDIKSNI